MSEFVKPEDMDDQTRTAVKRLVMTLADSKRLLGIRYSDWLLGAPSIETGIAASSMAQDEWGHARLLYAMLKDFDVDPVEVEHERAAEAYASLDALDEPFPDWAAVVAGMVIADGALTAALDGFARGSYEPATARVPKMLAEEEFHASLGHAWYRRLAGEGSDEARTLLREATLRQLPSTLAWLGNEDALSRALVEAGIFTAGEARVATFLDGVRDLVGVAGVDVDSVEPAPGWDEARARGPGHPDPEAVERARGDRNRMLLVE